MTVKATGSNGNVMEKVFMVDVFEPTDSEREQIKDALAKGDAGLPGVVEDQLNRVINSGTTPSEPGRPGGGNIPSTPSPSVSAKNFFYDVASGRLTPANVIDFSEARLENMGNNAELCVDSKSLKELNAAIVSGEHGEFKVRLYVKDKSVEKLVTVTLEGKLPDVSFSDVAEGAWYYGAVTSAMRMGYVNGHNGLYRPLGALTRAEAVAIIFNMAGGTELYGDIGGEPDTGFKDTDNTAWYARAVAWAHGKGIANGHDGNFRPNDPVTRAEFAAFIANYALAQGETIATGGDLSVFPDANDVPTWAREVVTWAAANKIMGNGGFLSPNANITRSEAAAMSVNYQPWGQLFEVLSDKK